MHSGGETFPNTCYAISQYLGIRAQQRLKGAELVIYEKNDDIGGVWLENRYPGAACDVPGHVYTYTFEPYNEWTTVSFEETECCKRKTEGSYFGSTMQAVKRSMAISPRLPKSTRFVNL